MSPKPKQSDQNFRYSKQRNKFWIFSSDQTVRTIKHSQNLNDRRQKKQTNLRERHEF